MYNQVVLVYQDSLRRELFLSWLKISSKYQEILKILKKFNGQLRNIVTITIVGVFRRVFDANSNKVSILKKNFEPFRKVFLGQLSKIQNPILELLDHFFLFHFHPRHLLCRLCAF